MISVVIVTKGERPWKLNACITALEHQTLKDFEIIIVPSREAPFLDSIRELNGISVQVLKQDAEGICNARNCGIRASKGAIIAFTDDDAEPFNNWIEVIIKFFEDHPDIDYIGGDFKQEVNNVWERWIDQSYHLSDVDVDRGLCHGNNMAYRRNVFDSHLFDENILFGADEAEFQLRLRENGLKSKNVLGMLIYHHHRNTFFSFSRMRWGYAQGHVYLYEKKFGQSLFHWADLMNIGFLLSAFYAVILFPFTSLFTIFPLSFLLLTSLHEKKSKFTFGTWLIQIYVSILWTVSKMYFSLLQHLRGWGFL